MTVMLRLDPRFPLLWRDAHTAQFGPATSAPRLTPVPWQERLLYELRRGITETGIPVWADMSGVHRRHVDDLFAWLGPLLLRERLEEYVPPAPRVLVDCEGAPPTLARVLRFGLEAAGWDVIDPVTGDPEATDCVEPVLAILLSAHAVGPWRAHPHLLADRPYLPVIAAGVAGLTIGPLVDPGASACTGCIDLHRRDDDEGWPTLATQLVAAPTIDVSVALAHEAGAVIARLLGSATAWSLGVPASRVGRTWTLRPAPRSASKVTTDDIVPHPECGCGAATATPSRVRRASPRRAARGSSAPGSTAVPRSTPPSLHEREQEDFATSA